MASTAVEEMIIGMIAVMARYMERPASSLIVRISEINPSVPGASAATKKIKKRTVFDVFLTQINRMAIVRLC